MSVWCPWMVVLPSAKSRSNGPKLAKGIRRTAQRPTPLPCGGRSSVSRYAIFDRVAIVRQGPESYYGSETVEPPPMAFLLGTYPINLLMP